MGEGNRTVLPRPLIGYYETENVKQVSLPVGMTITAENSAVVMGALNDLLEYPVGNYDVLLGTSGVVPVSVTERRVVTLHAQIEEDNSPVLFDQLLTRLQGAYDEIRVPGEAYGQTLRQSLVEAGFASDARPLPVSIGNYTQEGSAIVPVDSMVWFRQAL